MFGAILELKDLKSKQYKIDYHNEVIRVLNCGNHKSMNS
jgi:hypothetical protein